MKTRPEVSFRDCWNLESLYPKISDWEKDFNTLAKQDQPSPHWPELASFKGKLGNGEEVLRAALETYFSIERSLIKIYTYAHLRHDEDITLDTTKAAHQMSGTLLHDFAEEAAWMGPEILAIPEKTFQKYLASPILKDYCFYLEKVFRMNKYTLSTESEQLLALAEKALEIPYKTFSALSDADFKFDPVMNSKGEWLELTHGTFGKYIRDYDRVLRKNAFVTYHKKYLEFENTLGELIQGKVQAHLLNARARKYDSCLQAALYPKNIDTEVYHALIKAVNENLGVLHKYVRLRKKILNVSELHLYDMYVPLISEMDIKMPYEEAEELIVESVSPLGVQYQNALKKGLQNDLWVDRYENKNKRSGAYSSGCYDSMPYILMNYKDLLRDVFTLAHEAGHSMHSLMSHQNQPYQYGQYPIFLAEVASTFNEDLLSQLMLQRATSDEQKIFLINQRIEDIRTTLFRQTMFAEFELEIHALVEKNVPLTPQLLKREFLKLNHKYFGEEVIIDSEIEVEWARIPHFYYNFYVFQYATGVSAALALSEKVALGGEQEREAYLSFLKGGSSLYPIDLLCVAGVDMRTSAPVEAAINKFSEWVDQLEKLLSISKIST
jgi:oligoendopeptidase F